MKNLFDYELLVNDVFYRSCHVLIWIQEHPDMTELDREAVCNTIMDALVYKGLIDPEKESLDLDNLCIRESIDYFRYQEQPFVTSVPLWMWEQYEEKVMQWSGTQPASVFLSKPAGKASFCIYDMNYVSSSIFEDFTLIVANYDSPTRKGVRATARPFIEVEMNGEKYLIDWLTKRMFKSLEFAKRYNMEETQHLNRCDFNRKQENDYQYMTKEIDDENRIAQVAAMILPFYQSGYSDTKIAQMYYYMMKMKEKYKLAIENENRLMMASGLFDN